MSGAQSRAGPGVSMFGSVASSRTLAGSTGVLLIFVGACLSGEDGWSTLEVDTREVSSPDVTVTPDGSSIVFGLLGHLFALPEGGGDAIQLTFGPHFDARPAFSPDGSRVVFQSDRDGSEGNLFLLDVKSRHVSQVTFEPWADAPAWSPDGESLVYLRLARSRSGTLEAVVRRVWPDEDRTETLVEGPGDFRSPFVLGDGRPGWAAVDWQSSSVAATTHIRVLESDGRTTTLLSVEGVADAVLPGDDVIYARRFIPRYRLSHVSDDRAVIRIPLDGAPPVHIAPVDLMGIRGDRGEPRFGWAPLARALYVGDGGRLRRFGPSGPGRDIPFRARVRMEVRRSPPPPPWAPPDSSLPTGALLITNVRVLDFESGGFGAETRLLVEDGLISRIGSGSGGAIPDGTDTLDAQGRFAIPGLFEMHGHMDWCSDLSYVQSGITSMRNLGAEWAQIRRYEAARSHAVPNCFFGGPVISGWDFGGHVRPADRAEARALVRRLEADGASHVKLHYTLPWTLAAAAAEEALQLGLPVVRHADTAEDIVRTVVLGGHPTHLTGQHEDLLRLLARAGSRVDLTLQTSGSTAARRAHDAGVTVMLGTDFGPAPRSTDPPGPEAYHRGLEALRGSGIPAVDILRMATLTAAEAVGAGAYLGSLEEGKVADIVLLDRSPLDDVGNSRMIWMVLRAGLLVEPSSSEPAF